MNQKNSTEKLATEDDPEFAERQRVEDHPYNIPDDFWENGVIEGGPEKELISIRLDSQTLDYFRSRGRGYQARIDRVLRQYVQAQKLEEAKEQGRRAAEKTKQP